MSQSAPNKMPGLEIRRKSPLATPTDLDAAGTKNIAGAMNAIPISLDPAFRRNEMSQQTDSVIAVFADHTAADAAVGTLIENGFDMRHFSVVGKGYHTDEKVVGFYNAGDRMKFWGKYGAFWGGLWGLFFGGLFVTIPAVGPVIVLGYLAGMIVSAIEGALVVGGLSALGAALVSIGIPKDSVIKYEKAISADNFLVMANGKTDEILRAKAILEKVGPVRVDVNQGVQAQSVA